MPRVSAKTFLKHLGREIREDHLTNGAAALAYYLLLSIFPAMIFILTLLPYLPVSDLEGMILEYAQKVMPSEAYTLFSNVVNEIMSRERKGLLSFGVLFTLWAGTNGIFAIMQQLNVTYDVQESRPFWKARGTAIMLLLMFLFLLVTAFALILLGGQLESLLESYLGWGQPLLITFNIVRWTIILTFLLLVFAVTYYFGPDVEQDFRFITPGSVFGTLALVAFSLGFRYYVSNFGNYNASYGSLGAVIILMLWLYLMGLVLLLGSEINALVEHFHVNGKNKGQKELPPRVNESASNKREQNKKVS